MVHQKVQKLYFQSQFSMSKRNRIFSKTSLKAFSHQRRAKFFNTLRSKAFAAKKPFLTKKPQSNLTEKKFLAEKQPFWFIAIFGQEANSNLTKLFLAKKSFLAERPLHTDAFETISSGNNLLSD